MSGHERVTHSRREVVRMGGIASLGLLYTSPNISTVLAKPAFAGYGGKEPKKPKKSMQSMQSGQSGQSGKSGKSWK